MSTISPQKPKSSNTYDEDSQQRLFSMAAASSKTCSPKQGTMENWEQNEFFVQIKKDREDYNSSMGRKYNLNFNEEDIFDTSDDFGKRAKVIWQPIRNSAEMVRWNSYEEGQNQQNKNSILIEQNAQILIENQKNRLTGTNTRKIENLNEAEIFKSGKHTKQASLFGSQLVRCTQNTRDTLAQNDGQMTDRTEDPFENRLSSTIGSESILDSARRNINRDSQIQTDNIFQAMKETSKSQIHQIQTFQPQPIAAPAAPKIKRQKKKMMAAKPVPVAQINLFQLTNLTSVSLNYNNSSSNQQSIQENLNQNLLPRLSNPIIQHTSSLTGSARKDLQNREAPVNITVFPGNMLGQRGTPVRFHHAATYPTQTVPEEQVEEFSLSLRSDKKSSPRVTNRHAQVGIETKKKEYTSFLSSFAKRDLREKQSDPSQVKNITKIVSKLDISPKTKNEK